jgi:hypothetical protein
MCTLLNQMTLIIRPALKPTGEGGEDPAGVQQISEGAKGLQRLR